VIFDKLCGIVERHLHKQMSMLRNANLFVFDEPGDALITGMIDACDLSLLPFRTVAIDNGESCTVFYDREPDNVGLVCDRNFIQCLPVDNLSVADSHQITTNCYFIYSGILRGVYPIHKDDPRMDIIQPDWVNENSIDANGIYGVGIDGDITRCMVVTKKHVLNDIINGDRVDSEWTTEDKTQALSNVARTLQELQVINTPDRFILKKSSPKVRKKSPRNRLLRSDKRPIYTILKPYEIREKLHMEHPTGEGTVKASHERRAHPRYYRNAKYKFDKNGKERPIKYDRNGNAYYMFQMIPSCWIGASEKKIGNKVYKVILDQKEEDKNNG